MVALIVGQSPLLRALSEKLPEQWWQVPCEGDIVTKTQYLIDHPAPPRERGGGIVFASVPADWSKVSAKGWRVFWCDRGQQPLGTIQIPNSAANQSVNDMAKRFWGKEIADSRRVGELLMGRTQTIATLLFVTGFTGGVGKTTTAKRTAERAAEKGVRTLLIDGNMTQSSLRSFFDPARQRDVNTIADWHPGQPPTKGGTPGRLFGINYDLVFAPPARITVEWDRYAGIIDAARRTWQFVIVDLDRVSAADLTDPNTAGGALLTPYVRGGDLALFIIKAGRQTQGDAMNALSILPAIGLPRECVAIKDTIPIGLENYQQFDYSPYGTFIGTERQSDRSGKLLAAGQSNWTDPDLDTVRDKLLDWALPDHGFARPAHDEKKKKERRLFH